MKAKKKAEQPKRKRFTKASFRKRAKEDPEGFRKVYGPWTSLEATINILRGVVPRFPFKEDGSDVLGDIPFGPLDVMEFVCGFDAECGYNFSQPLCDTFAAYMKQGSKKTVKELSEVVENAFNDEKIEQRETFCDDGEHCRHFDIHDAFKEDEELSKEFGETHLGKQQCYLCKHWDNTHDGEPYDCTTGKCTYRWHDPNGKNQMTFWEEES